MQSKQKMAAHDFLLSDEADCVADKMHDGVLQMYAIRQRQSKKYKIDTPEGIIERDLVEADVGGIPSLVDRITGTVYRDGRCLTSNLRRVL